MKIGKKITVIDSYRGWFNGKEGIVKEIKDNTVGVKLVGVKYINHPLLRLTWFKMDEIK